jgi:hypothetical protein
VPAPETLQYLKQEHVKQVTRKLRKSELMLSMKFHKGKAIPLQALTGPEVSRRLGLPDF